MSGKRRIFVGDVQGCREELERLLERVRFDPAADELHPVGDLVNRGPDSLGTVRLARELGARGVLGNHDLHALAAAAGKRELGRRDTIQDLLAADDRDELLAWLGRCPFALVWDDVVCVHAGLHPAWRPPYAELVDEDPHAPGDAARFAVRVRFCDPDGNRPEEDDPAPGAPFRPWYELYDPAAHGGRTVVFGHWSVRGLVREPHVVGLDTGCVWGGELTAWIAEEDRTLAVPAARRYAELGTR